VEVLGAQLVFDGGTISDEDTMVRVLGARSRDSTRYKFFRLGQGLNLEVFEYRTEDSGRHPGNHQAGGHHLALYVDEIGPAVAHLRGQWGAGGRPRAHRVWPRGRVVVGLL
jgi:glyoxylase I family protein